MKNKIILIASSLLLLSCSAPDRTRSILEQDGYTNIEIKGYSIFACSEDDVFKTAFEATNTAGNRVSGVVCCGLFKSCTIRRDF